MGKDFDHFTIIDEVMTKLENNRYPLQQFRTDSLNKEERVQVRLMKTVDKTRVQNIVERFDPEVCDPIAVIVDDNDSIICIIDGNHRLAAHVKMKLEFTDVIKIPFVDLYYSDSALIKLGHKLNVDIIDKEECSNTDIKALITADLREGIDIRTPEYLRDLAEMYRRNPTGIGRLRQSVLEGAGEGSIKRPLTPEEAAAKANAFKEMNPSFAVYHTISRVAHEQGLGALIYRMSSANKNRGVLFVYHSRLDHAAAHADKLELVRDAADHFNIDIEVQDLGFVLKSEYN